jgi:hypothetical protein
MAPTRFTLSVSPASVAVGDPVTIHAEMLPEGSIFTGGVTVNVTGPQCLKFLSIRFDGTSEGSVTFTPVRPGPFRAEAKTFGPSSPGPVKFEVVAAAALAG